MVDIPDEELVLAAACGDVDSFIMLCHRHYPSMVAIARAVLGDHHLAEDAAQETLAKACRKIGELKSPGRFGAWVAAICRNEARGMLRRTPNAEHLGGRDVPESILQQNPDIEEMRQALDSLPVESRELLYLRYQNDLGYQAIADILRLSPEAVHGRLRRAKQDVQERLRRLRDRRPS